MLGTVMYTEEDYLNDLYRVRESLKQEMTNLDYLIKQWKYVSYTRSLTREETLKVLRYKNYLKEYDKLLLKNSMEIVDTEDYLDDLYYMGGFY